MKVGLFQVMKELQRLVCYSDFGLSTQGSPRGGDLALIPYSKNSKSTLAKVNYTYFLYETDFLPSAWMFLNISSDPALTFSH